MAPVEKRHLHFAKSQIVYRVVDFARSPVFRTQANKDFWRSPLRRVKACFQRAAS
jgi:hypothetical protein